MSWLIPVFCCVTSALAAPPVPQFDPQTLDAKVQIGYGLAIGDVDGDGKPDILLADKTQIVWYHNPGKAGEWAKHVMAENLTPRDNVCIAARDIDGDGKVEVAVGAQWNPSETKDEKESGAIFCLIRPADPTQKWEPIRIEPHDVTTHRMHWIQTGQKEFKLAVLPLHGKENSVKTGEGQTVRIQLITAPADPRGEWKSTFIDTGMHMTHNFDLQQLVVAQGLIKEILAVGGKEGVKLMSGTTGIAAGSADEIIEQRLADPLFTSQTAAGEVRLFNGNLFMISPMHGHSLVYRYRIPGSESSPAQLAVDIPIESGLNEGHALAAGPIVHPQIVQVVAGWRKPDANRKVGIKLYTPNDEFGSIWTAHVIDDNHMACEDLKLADLDGDGKLDIIASGRDSHNLIVYWNRTGK